MTATGNANNGYFCCNWSTFCVKLLTESIASIIRRGRAIGKICCPVVGVYLGSTTKNHRCHWQRFNQSTTSSFTLPLEMLRQTAIIQPPCQTMPEFSALYRA